MRCNHVGQWTGKFARLAVPPLQPDRMRPTTHPATSWFLGGLFLAASLTSLLADPPSPRLLKPEDFAAIRTVSDPQISPDGASVAYVVKTVDLADDKQPTNLWLAQWDGS